MFGALFSVSQGRVYVAGSSSAPTVAHIRKSVRASHDLTELDRDAADRSLIVRDGASISDAVRAIETSRMSVAVVLGDDNRIIGTITDGDVRRALLAGHGLEDGVDVVLNPRPVTCKVETTEAVLRALFTAHSVEAIPLVDQEGRNVRIAHVNTFRSEYDGAVPKVVVAAAVIMAGGEGTRLRPLTVDMPKPMVSVGGMPIIERTVRDLARVGVERVFVAINYQGHYIEKHLGDGARFGVAVEYLRETEKLGTAGALSLLPKLPDGPILVVNGDILTSSDYGRLLVHHRETGASITVGAIQHQVDIPFGVLSVEGANVTDVAEKPSQRILCNAGIYVLEPSTLDFFEASQAVNMTDIIKIALGLAVPVVAFPIHEYWSDVGTGSDLEEARRVVELMESENR